MAFTVLITIEGVLAEESTGLAAADLIPEGRMLYFALRSQFNIILSTLDPPQRAANWLTLQNIRKTDYARLFTREGLEHLDRAAVRHRHITQARALGYDLRYVFTDDPATARWCVQRGITPMCCPHPAYARSSFLPDSREGGLSWDQIEATQNLMASLRKADTRTLVDEGDTE